VSIKEITDKDGTLIAHIIKGFDLKLSPIKLIAETEI